VIWLVVYVVANDVEVSRAVEFEVANTVEYVVVVACEVV
jgi:hypothetical protein